MRVIRTQIAALNPIPVEAALQTPEFLIQSSTFDGQCAFRQIVKEHPHLVILQNELYGLDGLTILKKLREDIVTGFPYVVFLLPEYEAQWRGKAMALGADICLSVPFDKSELLRSINYARSMPIPAMAMAGKKEREAVINDLLDEMKLPHKLKGRRFIARGIDIFVSTGTMRGDFDNTLYPALGSLFGTTRYAVEKNIRTAIETTWLNGDLEVIQRLFGMSIDSERGKPTNSECISMLAEHTARIFFSNVVKARNIHATIPPG